MKHTVMRRKNYRMALVAGVLTVILTYLMIQILSPALAQEGSLIIWNSIKSPPSRTIRVLGITGGKKLLKYEVWIESHDGQILSALVCSNDQKCDPPQWKSESTTSLPNRSFFSATRASDCKNLGEFPLNPKGLIVECLYTIDASIDLVPQIYFALMADGSLKYYVIDLYNYFRIQGKIALASLLMFFGMFMFVFHMTGFVVKKKISLGRQRAIPYEIASDAGNHL